MSHARPERAARRQQAADEALLCRLFRRLTGHGAVDRNSDFVEIGGDSIAALSLAAALRQRGRDLPLATLFTARTPAAIAAGWAAGPAERPSGRPTLFVIPGVGGDNPNLAALRAEWRDVLDCVLVEYPDWPRLATERFDMDALVADMADRIRRRAPPGPLLLAGYSLGGFIGWEIARRQAATDRPVDALLLLDADNTQPVPEVTHATLTTRIRRLLRSFVAAVRDGAPGELTKLLGEFIGYRLVGSPALLRFVARFRRFRLPAGLRSRLRFSIGAELQGRIVRAWQGSDSLVPGFLEHDRVVVFSSGDPAASGEPADLGWRSACRTVQVVAVSGDHHTVLSVRGPASLHQRLPELIARFES